MWEPRVYWVVPWRGLMPQSTQHHFPEWTASFSFFFLTILSTNLTLGRRHKQYRVYTGLSASQNLRPPQHLVDTKWEDWCREIPANCFHPSKARKIEALNNGLMDSWLGGQEVWWILPSQNPNKEKPEESDVTWNLTMPRFNDAVLLLAGTYIRVWYQFVGR